MGAFPTLYFNAKVQRPQRSAKSQIYVEHLRVLADPLCDGSETGQWERNWISYQEKPGKVRPQPQKKTKRPQVTRSDANPSLDQDCPLNCSQDFLSNGRTQRKQRFPVASFPFFSFASLCGLCTFALNRRKRQSGECTQSKFPRCMDNAHLLAEILDLKLALCTAIEMELEFDLTGRIGNGTIPRFRRLVAVMHHLESPRLCFS